MSRLERAFRQAREEGRTALAIFLTAGHPTPDETPSLVRAAVEGGADVIELGVPFSDPLADGTTIQRANAQALAHDMTLVRCLALCSSLRASALAAPLVLMSYYNPLLRFGLEAFAREATRAGVDGVIVVDLPPEEATPLLEACRPAGLDLVFLLAPTSTEARIHQAATLASGFLYCVSVTGITGARPDLPPSLPDLLARVRPYTDLPLAVGFGIAQREHVQAIGLYADAAVVGSAVINAIDAASPEERPEAVRTFVARLTGRLSPVGKEEHR